MYLDELPDDVLLHIFPFCDAKDIESIRMTNWRLFGHISEYRHHYSKTDVQQLALIQIEDDKIKIRTIFNGGKIFAKIVSNGFVNNAIRSLKPRFLTSHDSDELANMNHMWWKDVKEIYMDDIIDFRRYSKHFDGLVEITVESKFPKNLADILKQMTTKSLQSLILKGDGELECSRDDLMKIGQLSNKLKNLILFNVSESSNITNDDVLDMIEIGSFHHASNIYISRIKDFGNIEECVEKREWLDSYESWLPKSIDFETNNGISFHLHVEAKCPQLDALFYVQNFDGEFDQ